MQKRHLNRKMYFEEQEMTTSKQVMPFINRHFVLKPGLRVFEIGCGEGGNLKPFLEMGCQCVGVDLSEFKISTGIKNFEHHPYRSDLQLLCSDIYDLPPFEQPFDLIFMRDVIEHIHNQERFMHFVKPFLSMHGAFFLAFPPWQNPFGGHQQICKSRMLSHLPWIHLLPEKLYSKILQWGGESTATITALLEVKSTSLTIERFDRILNAEKFRVINSQLYFVNPNYEVKFGLKPRKLINFLAEIPYLRNFLSTAAFYLVTKTEG